MPFIGWPMSEILEFRRASQKKHYDPPIYALVDLIAYSQSDKRTPSMIGMCFPGRVIVVIN